MALKTTYDDQNDIPEQYRDLYAERDGKWELTGIEGVKTQADIDRLNESLRKEREDHKKTKDRLKVWGDLDHDEVHKKLDQYEELKLKAEQHPNKDDIEAQVNKLAEAKVVTATAPLERELKELRQAVVEKDATINDFQAKETSRTISDAVRKAATEGKVVASAMDDILLLGERVFEVQEDGSVLTKDSVGVTPGVAPDIWLGEMQERRPHWWPASQGAGGRGSGGGEGFSNNPFSHDHWNLTEQGKEYKTNPKRAEQMAKAAGTTIGGPRPVAPKSAA